MILENPSFSFLLKLLGTHRAVPSTIRLAFKSNTRPMKPFVRTIVVVARDHVTVANIMAQAVLLVVSPFIVLLVFLIRITKGFLAVGVLVVCRGSGATSGIITAATLSL